MSDMPRCASGTLVSRPGGFKRDRGSRPGAARFRPGKGRHNSKNCPPLRRTFAPFHRDSESAVTMERMMELLSQISFDEVVAAFVTCLVIREILIFILPDHIAGPGGSFIDTGSEDF
jgi:hypothetical protein